MISQSYDYIEKRFYHNEEVCVIWPEGVMPSQVKQEEQ